MATVKYEGVKKKKEGAGLGNLMKKIPPWGWILIAVILLLMILWYRNKQAQAAATQSDQNASGTATQGATDSYIQGYDAAMTGSVGYGYGGGGGFGYPTTIPSTTPGLIDPTLIPPGTIWGPGGTTTTPNTPAYTPPPITINEPSITVTTPSTTTGGGLNTGSGGGGGSTTHTWNAIQMGMLAPGVTHPNYPLTRPAGHPNARWAGPHKPAGNWRGIGGGWWVPG